MTWLWPLVHWGVFAFGACIILLGLAAVLLDACTRDQYRGASSYRRDERTG